MLIVSLLMNTKKSTESKDSTDHMNTAVARVASAVRVASASVTETMRIKDEALDTIEESKTLSNSKAGNLAVKKIKTDSKKVLGK